MLHELWDAYQQGQIQEAASTAAFAKVDAAQTAARLHAETLAAENLHVLRGSYRRWSSCGETPNHTLNADARKTTARRLARHVEAV
jgi:hypothetical protein